jgi:hypothetical protein
MLISVSMFALLAFLPLHPMSLPISAGGGIAFGLILWRI